MALERTPIDITHTPELLRIAEEVRATSQPRVLERDGEAIAVVSPIRPKAAKRAAKPLRGKPTSPDDPYWDIMGMASSPGPTDVSTNKYKYLAEAYSAKGA